LAVEGFEALAKREPGNTGFTADLSVALRTRADHRLEMGEGAGVERDLRRSLGLLETVYQANPRSLRLLRALAECYQGLGDLSASRSHWKQAHDWYQKNLELWERWKQVGVSSLYDRQYRDLAARLVAQAAKNSSRPLPLP
jgi:tetratricopeptide (TPR) repeat protein